MYVSYENYIYFYTWLWLTCSGKYALSNLVSYLPAECLVNADNAAYDAHQPSNETLCAVISTLTDLVVDNARVTKYMPHILDVLLCDMFSTSEMTYIVLGVALNSTHSLVTYFTYLLCWVGTIIYIPVLARHLTTREKQCQNIQKCYILPARYLIRPAIHSSCLGRKVHSKYII